MQRRRNVTYILYEFSIPLILLVSGPARYSYDVTSLPPAGAAWKCLFFVPPAFYCIISFLFLPLIFILWLVRDSKLTKESVEDI